MKILLWALRGMKTWRNAEILIADLLSWIIAFNNLEDFSNIIFNNKRVFVQGQIGLMNRFNECQLIL